ncbi:MAG TPA: FG-GAP repeat protein, partial [Polyangiaceae bacterium]
MSNVFDRGPRRDPRARRALRSWPSQAVVLFFGAAVVIACGSQGRGTPSGAEGPADASIASASAAASPAPSAGDKGLVRQAMAAQQSAGGPAYAFATTPSGSASARLGAHHLSVDLAAGGVNITGEAASASAKPWQLGLRWAAIGRAANVAAVPAPPHEAEIAGSRATYRREDGSEEWYVSGPIGLEQGFVLPAPPAGSRSDALAIEIAVDGGLTPSLAASGDRVDLADATGATVARYGWLSASDADGAPVRAWLEVSGSRIRLRVDDANAHYPLTIDPVVWTLQQEVTATDAAASDNFGFSVATSGSLALVGAPGHKVGANAGA